MAFDPLTALMDIGGKVLDKVLPDKEKAAKAKLEMMKLAQDGQFRDDEMRMNMIVAEAKSADPWTSRARPSFLYVIYLYIVMAIPMGVLAAFSPDRAVQRQYQKAWGRGLLPYLGPCGHCSGRGISGTRAAAATIRRRCWTGRNDLEAPQKTNCGLS